MTGACWSSGSHTRLRKRCSHIRSSSQPILLLARDAVSVSGTEQGLKYSVLSFDAAPRSSESSGNESRWLLRERRRFHSFVSPFHTLHCRRMQLSLFVLSHQRGSILAMCLFNSSDLLGALCSVSSKVTTGFCNRLGFRRRPDEHAVFVYRRNSGVHGHRAVNYVRRRCLHPSAATSCLSHHIGMRMGSNLIYLEHPKFSFVFLTRLWATQKLRRIPDWVCVSRTAKTSMSDG